MKVKEPLVEDAALTWFDELGYAVAHRPQLAPGEPSAERDSFGEVVLVGRLREAIRRLNPVMPNPAPSLPYATRCCRSGELSVQAEPETPPADSPEQTA